MQYKTIVMEMLQQRTELHEQLRRERKLLTTMEMYAKELKASHEAIRAEFQKAHPDRDPAQTSSEAFEMALKEVEDRLPPESEVAEPAELSLSGAMAFIRNHSRRG
jgi:hypothetical protein